MYFIVCLIICFCTIQMEDMFFEEGHLLGKMKRLLYTQDLRCGFFFVSFTHGKLESPSLAEIPAPDWGTGSGIINEIKQSPFISETIILLQKCTVQLFLNWQNTVCNCTVRVVKWCLICPLHIMFTTVLRSQIRIRILYEVSILLLMISISC